MHYKIVEIGKYKSNYLAYSLNDGLLTGTFNTLENYVKANIKPGDTYEDGGEVVDYNKIMQEWAKVDEWLKDETRIPQR